MSASICAGVRPASDMLSATCSARAGVDASRPPGALASDCASRAVMSARSSGLDVGQKFAFVGMGLSTRTLYVNGAGGGCALFTRKATSVCSCADSSSSSVSAGKILSAPKFMLNAVSSSGSHVSSPQNSHSHTCAPTIDLHFCFLPLGQ